MTDQELIETMATKVMGWELSKVGGFYHNKTSSDREPVYAIMSTAVWNPLTNIYHAFMIVERMISEFNCDITMEHTNDWYVSVAKSPQANGVAHNVFLGNAICSAALKMINGDLDAHKR